MYTSQIIAFCARCCARGSGRIPHPRASAGRLQAECYGWSDRGQSLSIAVIDTGGGAGPAWLLLPVLSTISSRHEWQSCGDAVLVATRLKGHGDPAPRLWTSTGLASPQMVCQCCLGAHEEFGTELARLLI
jgi:hypothetical protein